MCWGIATGNGWYHLIDALCIQLQRLTDHDGAPQIIASQVKEKFGSLRFYTRESDSRQKAMIELVTEISQRTCDVCGAPVRLSRRGDWWPRVAKNTPIEQLCVWHDLYASMHVWKASVCSEKMLVKCEAK
jgi:hypothetical protein